MSTNYGVSKPKIAGLENFDMMQLKFMRSCTLVRIGRL